VSSDTLRGLNKKPASKGKKRSRKNSDYIKLKEPSDVMAYIQRLINKLHKDHKEFEELGKITNLLNTWIAAHKDHVETEEVRKLREELDAFKEQMEEK
jgi:hypothetical protein